MSRPLSIALLLITSGGFMDAFTFIAFGHVFTNAQSGNVVLFAVYAAQLDWAQTLKHVPPMLAFFPGVFAARGIARARLLGRSQHSDVVVLSVELMILVPLAISSGVLPPWLITFGIAFASAMQNSAFKTVDELAYTSVVTTGNLRSAAEALFDGICGADVRAYRKARILGSICAAFAFGAIVGAILTWPFGKMAIACPIFLIVAALVLCLTQDGRLSGKAPTRTGDLDH